MSCCFFSLCACCENCARWFDACQPSPELYFQHLGTRKTLTFLTKTIVAAQWVSKTVDGEKKSKIVNCFYFFKSKWNFTPERSWTMINSPWLWRNIEEHSPFQTLTNCSTCLCLLCVDQTCWKTARWVDISALNEHLPFKRIRHSETQWHAQPFYVRWRAEISGTWQRKAASSSRTSQAWFFI